MRSKSNENETRLMLERPITDLSKFIGAKWHLTLEQLAQKSGVPLLTIKKAVRGVEITQKYERKLREYLEKL